MVKTRSEESHNRMARGAQSGTGREGNGRRRSGMKGWNEEGGAEMSRVPLRFAVFRVNET
jgi:hypothetical protein